MKIICRVVLAVMAISFGMRVAAQQAGELEEHVGEEMEEAMQHYNEGVGFVEAEKLDQAQKAFEEALQKLGKRRDPDAKRLRAAAGNNMGNLWILQGHPDKAEPILREALEADPEHALALSNLGVAVLQQGRLEEAVMLFERARVADPEAVEPLKNLAELTLEMGKLRSAGEYTVAGLQRAPDDQRLLILLATVYERAGKPERQERVWQKLVESTDGSIESRLLLATYYLKQGIYAQAESILNEILAERPDYPEAQLQRARLLHATGSQTEAETLLRDLINKQPEEEPVQSELVRVLHDSGQNEDTLALARETVRKFPEDAEAWFVLGVCLESAGAFQEAEDAYRKAIAQDVRHARALNNLGLLAARKNDLDGAVKHLTAAMVVDPLYTDARYNLGRMLVISKKDFERGVALVAGVVGKGGESAIKARAFLDDLKMIAEGKDPGWGVTGSAE